MMSTDLQPHLLVPSPSMLALFSAPIALRIGGEWAGWSCSFNSASAAVQRIPEKYCTKDMIAYDTVPWGFEELTTEGGASRRTVRLLPAAAG